MGTAGAEILRQPTIEFQIIMMGAAFDAIAAAQACSADVEFRGSIVRRGVDFERLICGHGGSVEWSGHVSTIEKRAAIWIQLGRGDLCLGLKATFPFRP